MEAMECARSLLARPVNQFHPQKKQSTHRFLFQCSATPPPRRRVQFASARHRPLETCGCSWPSAATRHPRVFQPINLQNHGHHARASTPRAPAPPWFHSTPIDRLLAATEANRAHMRGQFLDCRAAPPSCARCRAVAPAWWRCTFAKMDNPNQPIANPRAQSCLMRHSTSCVSPTLRRVGGSDHTEAPLKKLLAHACSLRAADVMR